MEAATLELAKAGGPVFGSIVAILIFVILGMTVYIKSLISQLETGQQVAQARREETQAKLNEVYEARVQESRLAVTSIEQNTSKLIEFGRVQEIRGQAIERIVLVLDKVSGDQQSMSISRREYIIRIENLILENREMLKRAERNIEEKIERLNQCCKALGARLQIVGNNVEEIKSGNDGN